MKQENNIDFNNISLILDMLKNNKKEEKKQDKNQDNLLMINSTNSSYIKDMLPLITDNSENVYKMINCLEINQLITNHKKAYQSIEKEKVLDLKKEAILHIKNNLNQKNKYMVDLLVKVIEIKDIMNKNYKEV